MTTRVSDARLGLQVARSYATTPQERGAYDAAISALSYAVELEAQVTALKLRAIAAHEALWRAMNAPADEALAALRDGGYVHEAVHKIIAVETESVTVPNEWRAHIEQQDRRIDRLEAERRR